MLELADGKHMHVLVVMPSFASTLFAFSSRVVSDPPAMCFFQQIPQSPAKQQSSVKKNSCCQG